MKNPRRPQVEELESRVVPTTTSLILDVNTLSPGSIPSRFVSTGDLVFFVADDVHHGRELWRTDGSDEGTFMVRDFTPGPTGTNFSMMFELNGKLVFKTLDTETLWITDGTTAGTTILRTGLASDYYALAGSYRRTSTIDGVLYFGDRERGRPLGLWRTDGTPEGTFEIESTVGVFSGQQVAIDNEIYFVGTTPATGAELWVTDGTSSGTRLVRDILPGSGSSGIDGLANLNGKLYFLAQNLPANERGIWTSDGTFDGTQLALQPGAPFSVGLGTDLFSVGDRLYFEVFASQQISFLYSSDGTPQGTEIVPSSGFNPNDLTPAGELLFFTANSASGVELFRTDGTSAGTFTPVDPTPGSNKGTNPRLLTSVGDAVYFAIDPANFGDQKTTSVWRSDGTTEGTFQLAPTVRPDQSFNGAEPYFARLNNGKVVFTNSSHQDSREVWITDETPGGTSILKNINNSTYDGGSNPVELGDLVYFMATPNNSPNVGSSPELWTTDGTAAGTSRLLLLGTNGNPIIPRALFRAGDWLIIATNNPSDPFGSSFGILYRTDGTQAGTSVFFDARDFPGYVMPNDRSFLFEGGKLFFRTNKPGGSSSIWMSDLTPSGNVRLDSLHPDIRYAGLNKIRVIDGVVYFVATSFSEEGDRLWRTDGTPGGTARASNARIGFPANEMFAVLNDIIYFVGLDQGRRGLYRTDGTVEGTELVYATEASGYEIAPRYLTALNGSLFFSLFSPIFGDQLWISDGTAEGTRVLADVSSITEMYRIGDKLFFFREWGNFLELGVTDGTTVGTKMLPVKTSRVRTDDRLALDWNGRFLFSTYADRDGDLTGGMWISDGTDEGTFEISDDLGPTQVPSTSFVRSYNVAPFRDGLIVANANRWYGMELFRISQLPLDLQVRGSSITAPADWNDFQLDVYDLSNTDSNAIYTFQLDWDGDGDVDEVLSGPSGTVVRHRFTEVGTHRFTLTAISDDGRASRTVERTIECSPALQIEVVSLPGEVVSNEEIQMILNVRGEAVSSGVGYLVTIDVDGDNDFARFYSGTSSTIYFSISTSRNGLPRTRQLQIGVATTTGEMSSISRPIDVVEWRREFRAGQWDYIVGLFNEGVDFRAYFDQSNQRSRIVTITPEGVQISSVFAGPANLPGTLTLFAGPKSNRIDVSDYPGPVTVYGGSGDDTILGSAYADTIFGDNEHLLGRNGNDSIDAGTGADVIVGDGAEGSRSPRLGNDTIVGGSGNNIIYGDRADDVGHDGAEGGDDLIFGGPNDDFIDSQMGDDTIDGGGGVDTVLGGGGKESIARFAINQHKLLVDIALSPMSRSEENDTDLDLRWVSPLSDDPEIESKVTAANET